MEGTIMEGINHKYFTEVSVEAEIIDIIKTQKNVPFL